MLYWVEKVGSTLGPIHSYKTTMTRAVQVLEPYVRSRTEGDPSKRSVILLDSYRCHMMATVVSAIQNLGVEVQHIPGGCSGLVQPVDVGMGKPLKDRVRAHWDEWMVEQYNDPEVDHEKIKPPTRETLSQWIVTSLRSLSSEIVQHA